MSLHHVSFMTNASSNSSKRSSSMEVSDAVQVIKMMTFTSSHEITSVNRHGEGLVNGVDTCARRVPQSERSKNLQRQRLVLLLVAASASAASISSKRVRQTSVWLSPSPSHLGQLAAPALPLCDDTCAAMHWCIPDYRLRRL